MIVQEHDAPQYMWYTLIEDTEAFIEYAQTVCHELVDIRFDGPLHMEYMNIAEQGRVTMQIAGVFAVTFISMRYSASRLRGRNIVETIRSDSGM